MRSTRRPLAVASILWLALTPATAGATSTSVPSGERNPPARGPQHPAGTSAFADAQQLFERANSLYRGGDYHAAAGLYRRVLALVPTGLAARYNLGNALYREGRRGAALQQYLTALRRAPRDARARNNTAVVRRDLAAGMPPGARDVIAAPLAPPLSWLSLEETVWGAVPGAWLLAGLGALAILRPRTRRWAARGAALIFVALALVAGSAARAWLLAPQALAIAPEAQARAGPSLDRPVVLTVPEGAALRVGTERAEWAFVSLPNGLSGWVPRRAVGFIP